MTITQNLKKKSKTKKIGRIVGISKETDILKKNYQVVPLWGLVAKAMVNIYGEKNLALIQEGGSSKLAYFSKETYNIYHRHTITIPTPDFVDRKVFTKPDLTLVSPEGENIIAQYVELVVQNRFITWKADRKSSGKIYYEN